MPPHRTRDHSRGLEVTTDVPFTPTVDIVSPTPRAFTFPIRQDFHNASPSCSPFEPEQKPVATPPPVRAFSPSSSIGSEASSLNSSPSVLSSQASHKRRRSVAGDNERRPKKGDEDYIKRPENAFILFRRKCCEDRQIAMDEMSSTTDDGSVNVPVKKQRQADLSKTISQQWKTLSGDERAYWEELAKEKKKEHGQLYPNYVYRPQRVPKGRKKGKGKRGDDQDTDNESGISFVLPVPSPPRSLSPTRYDHGSHGHNRRAASAPTPPPQYQTIQLPSVIMPSCPPSPSLLPRISRRTPLPQYHIPSPHDSDPSTHFEYLPDDTLQPVLLRSNFDTTLSAHDSFQIYHLNDEPSMSDRSHGVPLHSLSIPPSQSMYTSSSMVSPSDSLASSMMSPADSIASALSPNGPYTPADVLSLSHLSLANQSRDDHDDQDVMDPDLEPHMGFGGYEWGSQNHWHNTDILLQDDFDVDNIPPVEIGGVPLDVPCDMDGRAFSSLSEENDYNDTTPGGDDDYSRLFSYEPMSW
ncbi:hypothetical protein EUX98_g5109 [Antrodiella citrinella]|uniref:HMG box domain-containing protein n=1 Tax=Antrodiella citrinella TaxID=2447956 RepID=A0A4S4MV47_9APHY|nr:hypothetical protein EUX98_g5109 [Antrodiella citrinella]